MSILRAARDWVREQLTDQEPNSPVELADAICDKIAEMRDSLAECNSFELGRPCMDVRNGISRLYAPAPHPLAGLAEMSMPGAAKRLNALGNAIRVQSSLHTLITTYEGPKKERVRAQYKILLEKIAAVTIQELPGLFEEFAAEMRRADDFFVATDERGKVKPTDSGFKGKEI